MVIRSQLILEIPKYQVKRYLNLGLDERERERNGMSSWRGSLVYHAIKCSCFVYSVTL